MLFNINNFYIVDTPGFSSIDINEYTKEEIKSSFVEFRNITCKYNDCKHIKEQDCEVIKLVNNGKILKSRYKLTKSEVNLILGTGYAKARNAIMYFALKRKIDYLLFWDDDEYPYANIKGENNGYRY